MTVRDPLPGWQSQLSVLAVELREALLPWLERLDLAVGPMAAAEPLADGDPDGFLGLSRRGPYERLLLSEWLMASEVPDEFLRRAAAGEHAFLELSRRSEAGSQVTAVLFDAGPWQLGAPRIAHLALLLVMARRAQNAGAKFFWGVLQQPGVLRESVIPDQAVFLLSSRSRRGPERAHLEEFSRLPALAQARRELWIVGGPEACAMAPGPCIEVIEPISDGRGALVAQLRRVDRSTIRVELPLPPEEQCIRALRDPFERPAAVRKNRRLLASGEARSLFFSDNGRRLFAGLDGGGFIAYPVPNSPYASPAGEPTTVRPTDGKRILAAGWEKNQGILLLQQDERFWLRTVGRKGGKSCADQPLEGSLLPADGPLVPLHSLGTSQGTRARAMITPRGQYAFISPKNRLLTRMNVVAIASINHLLTLARYEPTLESVSFEIESVDGAEQRKLAPVVPDASGEVFWGYAEGNFRHGELVLCGVERKSVGDWALFYGYEGASYLPLSIPPEERVVGVFQSDKFPGLLVLSGEQRELRVWGPSGVVRVAHSAAPITSVAVSSSGPYLAYTTEEQELVLLSSRFSQPILRVKHGGK